MTQEGDHGGEPSYGVTMADSPQWYDSIWLDKYLAAKAIVAPERLTEFVESFSALRTHRYLAERAARACIPKALGILKRAGAGLPPAKGDELPGTKRRQR